MTPAEIAAKLTPAQVRALQSMTGEGSKEYPPDLHEAEEMVHMAMMQAPGFDGFHGVSSWTLCGWVWDKDPANRWNRLNARVVPTPLGRAVLADLEGK